MDSCLRLLCLDSATIRWYKNSAPSVHWFTKSQSFGMLGADLTRFGRIYVRYRGRRFTVPSKLWSDHFIPAKQEHIRTKDHPIPLRYPESRRLACTQKKHPMLACTQKKHPMHHELVSIRDGINYIQKQLFCDGIPFSKLDLLWLQSS